MVQVIFDQRKNSRYEQNGPVDGLCATRKVSKDPTDEEFHGAWKSRSWGDPGVPWKYEGRLDEREDSVDLNIESSSHRAMNGWKHR